MIGRSKDLIIIHLTLTGTEKYHIEKHRYLPRNVKRRIVNKVKNGVYDKIEYINRNQKKNIRRKK